jgi:hypothetical protein
MVKPNILFSIILLPLIFAFAMAPSEFSVARGTAGKSATFDYSPMLQFFSNTQHADVAAVLTAVSTDSGDGAGVLWIEMYQDGSLIGSKDCGSPSPVTCTFSKTVTETLPVSHTYYAKTKDKGNHIVQSSSVTVSFEGVNHVPQIDSFVPTDTTPEINVSDNLHFEVWASDLDNDVLDYSWTLDDILVSTGSTASGWNYQPVDADEGIHDVEVIVEDGRGGQDSQAWTVTVTMPKRPTQCSLSFNPISPINYTQQPFIASCSCTNPEANAVLWRDGFDVTAENNIPVTLAANPSGYNYICNVGETDNYLGASNSSTYLINRAQTILNLTFQPSWNVVYNTTTNVSCGANNAEVTANLYRNNVLVNNPNVDVLAAGIYNYYCSASESQNWTAASTAVGILNVSKAASQVNLLINGVDGDVNVNINDSVAINASLISLGSKGKQDDSKIRIKEAVAVNEVRIMQQSKQIPQQQKQAYIELWIDGQIVASGENNISYSTSFSTSGTYNVTVLYPETQNYLSSYETHFIAVNESADTIDPVVNLVSPIDGAVIGLPNVTINNNVTDNNDTLLDCAIWSNTTGTWQIDTVQQTQNNSSNDWNYSNLANGTYIWNVQCSDDSGNTAFAPQNWSFTIVTDIEAPVIVFVSPTPDNGASIDVDYTFINTTITDNTGIVDAVLEWNGTNETMNGSGTNYHSDRTNLDNGTYSYKVYASDAAGNWNMSETRTLTVNVTEPAHDIAVEALTLLKDVDGTNKSIESSTAYLNDQVYVLALVHNLGNVAETANVTLQNNIGVISTKEITLNADETAIASFVWNANPEGWHTVEVKAEPVAGETNLANNDLSQDVQVWKVCNVVDCSIFGPRTAQSNYTLGQAFLARTMIQNLWNNETFKDVKFELVVDNNGLQITTPWPSIQYTGLNMSQFVVGNWNVTSMNTGNYSITAYVGNREFNKTKYVNIM